MKGLVVTYLLTYGGAAVSLINPYVGLLIYICFAIIKPEALWHWSVPAGNYSRIVAIGLLAGWAINGFGKWTLGKAWGVVGCLVGYWLWMVLTTTTSEGVPAWDFVESMFKVVLPYVVGISLIDSVRKVKILAWVILISHAYLAWEFNLAYLGGNNILQEDGFAGMDNNSVAIALVTCTGLAFFLGLYAWSVWLQLVALASAALLVHAVLFSFSRGGMLGLVCTGAISFILIPKKPKHYLLFALGVAVTLRMAGPEVWARFFTAFANKSNRDVAAQNRADYWGYCWELMKAHPLTGIGPRQFADAVPRYFHRTRAEAHSLWLQTGAEMGFPGMFLIIGFYALCARRLWKLARHPPPGPTGQTYAELSRMVIASLAGFVVSSQFVSLYGLEAPYYINLIGAGVLKLASTTPAEEAEEALDPASEEEANEPVPFPVYVP